MLGPQVWELVRGGRVLDFGCGIENEAVELAQRGAREAVGLDIREPLLERARKVALAAGVSNVAFTTQPEGTFDTIVSLDAFEHFADPARILHMMAEFLSPRGRVLAAFGPPWLHPLGGHLFSVFPWAHLIFTEASLIRWRADFKTDGATRFGEVEGGLNQMTVRRFERIVAGSPLAISAMETVPIRG